MIVPDLTVPGAGGVSAAGKGGREPAVLRTQRLELRAPDEHDVDALATLCQDSDVQRWTTVPAPYTREDAIRFATIVVPAGWADGTSLNWGVRLEDRLIGMGGLHRIGEGEAELGYWLGREFRGRGLMAEAARTILDYAFEVLRVQRVEWHAFVGNTASAAVARRAGFRFEGTVRLGCVQRGRRVDDWQAGLLAEDPRAPAEGWPSETFPVSAR